MVQFGGICSPPNYHPVSIPLTVPHVQYSTVCVFWFSKIYFSLTMKYFIQLRRDRQFTVRERKPKETDGAEKKMPKITEATHGKRKFRGRG